jgi:hypothetical protein
MRSITDQMGTVERFVAPPDFLKQLESASKEKIFYGIEDLGYIDDCRRTGTNLISTIPLPVLWRMMYPGEEVEQEFGHRSGINVLLTLSESVSGFASLYIPDPTIPAARISLTRNVISVEFYGAWEGCNSQLLTQKAVDLVWQKLGIDQAMIGKAEVRRQPFAKILPIDEAVRQRMLVRLTDDFGIYSLGRYATWRPGLLLDDLVKDVRQIVAMADRKDRYSYRLKG